MVTAQEVFDEIGEEGDPYDPAEHDSDTGGIPFLQRLFDAKDESPGDVMGIEPLSRLLTAPDYYVRPPAGAVLPVDTDGRPVPIQTGTELATLFEAETPGLWHRHVLNVILNPSADPASGNPNPFFGGAGSVLSDPRETVI